MAMIAYAPSFHTPTMTRIMDRAERAFALPVALYFLGVILPTELSINLFGLALFPVRIALLLFFVPAVLRLSRMQDLRLQAFDYCLALALVWLLLALVVNNGIEKGVKFGGSLVLEAMGGYLLARAYIRTFQDFARAVRIYFIAVLAAAAVAAPEAFLGIKFVHAWASALTGHPNIALTSEAGRLGLERATSTFDHPILYGVFCATLLGPIWYLYQGTRQRWIRAAAVAFATFCSVSSAPMLAYGLAVGFILWELWSRPFAHRVSLTIGGVAAVLLAIELVSNRSAIEVLISYLTLDGATAYYRILIWQYAGAVVLDNPIFGAPLYVRWVPTWMSGSVDTYWLVTALSGGLPTAAFLVAAVLALLWRVHAPGPVPDTPDRWRARFGWTAAVLALCLQAFTVHYWGAMHSLFFFLLGMGAWLTDARASGAVEGVAATEPEHDSRPPGRGLVLSWPGRIADRPVPARHGGGRVLRPTRGSVAGR